MAHVTRIKTSLAVHAHRKVSGLLDGQYASSLAGRSLDFADLREYVAGDDVKDIDWKATARHGAPLVKRFVADRKHTVVLTIATGRTMAAHSTPTDLKSDVALMAAGLLGYLATRHGDYVGLCASDGEHVEAIRPSMREIDVERMLNLAEAMCSPAAPEPDLESLLSFVLAASRRRNIVVLVMDDRDLSPVEVGLLRRAVAQHQVLLVTVGDLDPAHPGAAGRGLIQVGSGRVMPDFVQTDRLMARQVAEATDLRRRRRAELCAELRIADEHVGSCDEVIGAGLRLLRKTRDVARR